MNVASSPIFLNSAGNVQAPMTEGIRLLYSTQLPVIDQISGTDVVVKSIYAGVQREESYASLSGESLVLFADANTPITITGEITELSIRDDTYITKLKCLNTALIELDCSGCTGLTSLDLSTNTALQTLNCSGCTGLAALDLSTNTALQTLNCYGCTGLAALDLSTNTALQTLNCYGCTSLAALDLSTNTALQTLDCKLLDSIAEIKTLATNEDVATAIAGAITGANAEDGKVYVSSDDTYYSTVADAAVAKGWTVEDPAA